MDKDNKEIVELVDAARGGDQQALETLIRSVQDMIFNLSLRMLGTVPDAEDATQEIIIRILSKLATFRKESAFSTWVYRLAVNSLINYKKSMFSEHPLSFEYYGQDIRYGKTDEVEDLVEGLCKEQCVEELKMSCTNVMLQCLEPESRCIFILGTMFKMDSKVTAEVLNITPENYRQKLCRIRKKVANFLSEYCGLSGTGMCNCHKRINYALSEHRINPKKLEFNSLTPLEGKIVKEYTEEMEELYELALTFENFPNYKSPRAAEEMLGVVLRAAPFKKIQQF